eukprot:m51a1_g1564 putative mob kinase activator 1a isoform x1 (212) ;mRNA; f:51918-53113
MFRFKGKETTVVQYKHKEQKHNEKLYQSLKASLGSGTMIHRAVKLPPGEDVNRWIAVNTIELYNTTLLCYGVVAEFCTTQSCPKMSAGQTVEYRWQKEKGAPVIVPAPEYVDLLADWAFEQLNDPTLFPEAGTGYPKNFIPACKKILTRLFRVFGHIYHSHWEDVKRVGAEPHMNTSFKHFYFFVNEFKLLEESDMVPVAPLIEKIKDEHQ